MGIRSTVDSLRLRAGIAKRNQVLRFGSLRLLHLVAPDAVRGGNYLYLWLWAHSHQSPLRTIVVEHRDNREAWLAEFPRPAGPDHWFGNR